MKIWMCWFQGLDSELLPEINKTCINRWKELNPDYEFVLITYKNVDNYVPGFSKLLQHPNIKKRKMSQKADLLRAKLLELHGGIWVDASVYPTVSLNAFYDKIINDTKFFAYIDLELPPLVISSWFLVSDGPCVVMKKVSSILEKKMKSNDSIRYFEFHETIIELYKNDNKVNSIISNMPRIDRVIPHCLNGKKKYPRTYGEIFDHYMYKRPTLKNFKKLENKYGLYK